MERSMKRWVSVSEYAKLIGAKSPQVVYNWLIAGKISKDKTRTIMRKKPFKQIYYEKSN